MVRSASWLIVVGSLALLLAVLTSPPPATVAVLVTVAGAAHGDAVHEPGALAGVAEQRLLDQWSADEAGGEAVYLNVVLGPLHGHCLRQLGDGGLGGAVDGDGRERGEGGHGTDVDDLAAARVAHERKGGLREEVDAPQVRVVHATRLPDELPPKCPDHVRDHQAVLRRSPRHREDLPFIKLVAFLRVIFETEVLLGSASTDRLGEAHAFILRQIPQPTNQSLGANPFRLIGLAWLSSIPLVSIFRGCFLAHSMHVVTPGSASSRASAIGRSQSAHSLRFGRLRSDGSFDPMRNEGGPQLQHRAVLNYLAEVAPAGATGMAVFTAPIVTGLGFFEAVDDSVLLALADPWARLDPRYERTARCLGAAPWRVLLRVRLPLLMPALAFAAALGAAVSLSLYLPTVLAGGGRIATLATEAIALASGGDRRIVGVYGSAQALIIWAGFFVAYGVARRAARPPLA